MSKTKIKNEEKKQPDSVLAIEEASKTATDIMESQIEEKVYLVEKISPEVEAPSKVIGKLVCPFCKSENIKPIESEEKKPEEISSKLSSDESDVFKTKEGGVIPEAVKDEPLSVSSSEEIVSPTIDQAPAASSEAIKTNPGSVAPTASAANTGETSTSGLSG